MNIVEIYYVSAFIISVILSGIYSHLWHKNFNVNLSLLFGFIPIANLGYVFLVKAKTLEEAVIGIQVNYLGGCFLILFITFIIFDLCQIVIPPWLTTCMLGLSMFVYLCVLTIGYSGIFYKTASLKFTKDGIAYLEKEYGPIHTLYYVMMAIYLLVSLATIVLSLWKKREVSRRIIWLMAIPEILSFFAFFGGRMLKTEVEFIPVYYVFAQVVYLLIAHQLCIYDVSNTAMESITETGDTGFISFDFRLNYLGSNETAKSIFSGLHELTLDKSLKKFNALWNLFGPWIEDFQKDETQNKFYYEEGDKVYLVEINYLYHRGSKKGFLFLITDDTKNQQYIKLLDSYNSDLEREVEEKTAGIVKMHSQLIRSMAMLVESRDNSTGGHIVRTSDVVEILMDEIMKDETFIRENCITEEFRRNIIKAAPLHDIGKIAVDDAILRKPGRFTDEEFEIMKTHAPEGARVLRAILEGTDDVQFKALAENVAKYHHERMDGSGYPEGKVGDAIPLEARIMAIADVYDALVSKRVYKESMSFEKADSIMMESMGKHFDERLKKFYLAARPRIEEYYVIRGDH